MSAKPDIVEIPAGHEWRRQLESGTAERPAFIVEPGTAGRYPVVGEWDRFVVIDTPEGQRYVEPPPPPPTPPPSRSEVFWTAIGTNLPGVHGEMRTFESEIKSAGSDLLNQIFGGTKK